MSQLTPTQLHRRAMEHADGAILLMRAGGSRTSIERKWSFALKWELKAADAVGAEGPQPSRAILLRSASSMALNAGNLREAERLASLVLVENSPEFAQEEARVLLEDTRMRFSLKKRGRQLASSNLEYTMKGPAVGHGLVEGSEVTTRSTAIQKTLVRIAEMKSGQEYRRAGRSAHESAYRLYYEAFAPASFAVRVLIAEQSGQTRIDADTVIDALLDGFEAVAENNSEKLQEAFPEPAYRESFRQAAKLLAPDGERIRQVKLASNSGGRARVVCMISPYILAPQGEESASRRKATQLRPDSTRYVGLLEHASREKRPPEIKVELEDGSFSPSIRVGEGLDDLVLTLWGQNVEVAVRREGRHRFVDSIKPLG